MERNITNENYLRYLTESRNNLLKKVSPAEYVVICKEIEGISKFVDEFPNSESKWKLETYIYRDENDQLKIYNLRETQDNKVLINGTTPSTGTISALIDTREISKGQTEEIKELSNLKKPLINKVESEQAKHKEESDKEEIKKIIKDTRLVDAPRSLDNSTYKGYQTTQSENDTLDILEQAKTALKEDEMTKDTEIVKGQCETALKNAQVVKKTENYVALISGRKTYVYELEKLNVQAPATAEVGEKVNLSWATGEQKATLKKAQERKQSLSISLNEAN